MRKIVFGTYGHSPALAHGKNRLESWGYAVTADPAQCTHLLLPVPTFDENGYVKGGGMLSEIMPQLSPDTTIFGGGLEFVPGRTVDFLKDKYYLTENAAITAQCTMDLVEVSKHTKALIIGWGRIGKHLAPLLCGAGAEVSVAVRKQAYFEAVKEGGFTAVYLWDWEPKQYNLIVNTAPAPVLRQEDTAEDAVLVDLASRRGISGDRVQWARGLPGKYAPELSGTLIAKTALRYALEGGKMK